MASTAQRLHAGWRRGESLPLRRPVAFAASEKASLPPPDFVLLSPKGFADRHRIQESDVIVLIETAKISVIHLDSGNYISIPDADLELLRLRTGGR